MSESAKAKPKLSYSIKDVDRAVIRPNMDENFCVSKPHQQLLDIVHEMSEDAPQNVLLTGPQGCGKTDLAAWFAAKTGRQMIQMNCAVIRENKDWFGYKDAQNGSVFWHKADFVRALSMGNCVILLDEFNRLHSTLHNSLYPLLDARRSTYVEELGEMLKVGPGTVFFATCNIGYNHTGTFTMDAAVEDRFGIRLEVTFLGEKDECKVLQNKTAIDHSDAEKLCRFANDIRRKANGSGATLSRAVSTRQLLQTAVLMRKMREREIPVRNALEYTVVPYFPNDTGHNSEQAQVLQSIQGIFGGGKADAKAEAKEAKA